MAIAAATKAMPQEDDSVRNSLTPEGEAALAAFVASPLDPFWTEAEGILAAALTKETLATAYAGTQAALGVVSSYDIVVDMDRVNEAVRSWAESYGYDLVKGLTDTTHRQLAEAHQRWMTGEIAKRGLPDLIEELTPIFGASRAELVGVTETTRAFALGNQEVYRQVPGAVGLVWKTAADEMVCTHICRPLNGKLVGFDGDFRAFLDDEGLKVAKDPILTPPAHPRCRCRIVCQLADEPTATNKALSVSSRPASGTAVSPAAVPVAPAGAEGPAGPTEPAFLLHGSGRARGPFEGGS